MRQWFAGLTQREQLSVVAMGFCVVLWLVYQLALAPVHKSRVQMAANNVVAAELLGRVDAKAAELIALRARGEQAATGNLTTRISRSSELAGLPVRRLQPNSRGEVQVRFESVDYDALVRWLHRIEVVEGLLIVDASIGQAGRAGGVNASLRITDAG